MAGKKKKGKKKKKDRVQKSGLSNREREIYLLSLAELEHKIEWRKHMCAIIDKDLSLFEEKLQLQQKDKSEVIKLLEDAIEEQRTLTEKIQQALPDVEISKSKGVERRAQELGAKLLQINQERLSNDSELEILRKKLDSLETYIPDKIDEKIKEIEKQLEEEDAEDAEDAFLRAEEQDIRRKEIFKKDMQDILQKEADAFQVQITGKLDKNFERITEETRWWADTVNGLRIETERLEALSNVTSSKLQVRQRALKQRKAVSLRENKKLQDGEAYLKAIMHSNRKLESVKNDISQRQDYVNFLSKIAEDLKESVDSQENYFEKCLNEMKSNESEINDLEEKLSNEISFGNQLKEYVEKAQELIAKEVKQSLILTYDGAPEQRNTVEIMRCLFEEATRFIYDQKTKSMI